MAIAIECKAPRELSLGELGLNTTVFLAGSIEMGKAQEWQQAVINACKDLEIIFYNPRRDDWDSSWTQCISNPEFNEQVTWELDKIDSSEAVIFYFDPDTTSPVTLLELGYVIGDATKEVIVCCPDGYFRRGNIEIMCERSGIPFVNTLEDLIGELRERIMYG